MTDSIPFSSRFLPASSIRSTVRPSIAVLEPRQLRPSPLPMRSAAPFVLAEDRVSQGMLLGLVAVTLTSAVYSLVQAWSLVGGDTLNHAVHAFMP